MEHSHKFMYSWIYSFTSRTLNLDIFQKPTLFKFKSPPGECIYNFLHKWRRTKSMVTCKHIGLGNCLTSTFSVWHTVKVVIELLTVVYTRHFDENHVITVKWSNRDSPEITRGSELCSTLMTEQVVCRTSCYVGKREIAYRLPEWPTSSVVHTVDTKWHRNCAVTRLRHSLCDTKMILVNIISGPQLT